jgi:hypothetical protein
MKRAEGPKRNAERYARHHLRSPGARSDLRALVADAWMAGYRAAARARRTTVGMTSCSKCG